jgi:hypothetical protein
MKLRYTEMEEWGEVNMEGLIGAFHSMAEMGGSRRGVLQRMVAIGVLDAIQFAVSMPK